MRGSAMVGKGNRGYGKAIADAVLAAVDSPLTAPQFKTTSWLDSWTNSAEARDRARRWLSMWLKADLKDIPPSLAARYLNEMAKDVESHGSDEAVKRFIDKILPKILTNEITAQTGKNAER